ncbi:7800_t:CDS:2 [Dentiscutata heterogama]|uniref:7800_t:CDS:1 n=1 Tax=Dentiscutata heterogama TaxID=1316150 RepID=A0ACA9L152_9GLOM|nr:7800_t:CDS:2 [Dentiscutata heterogama]
MSSLRNAVHRRNHKERAQPRSRQRYGLLEKHKDYVLRSRDYHAKQSRLKNMREKAYFRNPDEFYFKMINSKTKEGVHIIERNSAFSGDMIKLLKSQDLNYVKTQCDLGNKKIEKIQNELHFIDSDLIQNDMEVDEELSKEKNELKQPQHIIFFDSKKEAKKFNPTKYFDTLPELINRKFNRPRIKTLESDSIMIPDDEELQILHKNKLLKYQDLKARIKRQNQLEKAEQELQTQKNLMGKGRRVKIGVDANGLSIYRWKNDRKK